MTSSAVVITGQGALCALGDTPDAILSRASRHAVPLAPPTVFDAAAVDSVRVAEVPDFAPQHYIPTGNLRPLDRTGRLALVGVELALRDSGWSQELRASRPLGLVLGTMFCSVRTIAEFDRRAQQAGPAYASPMDFSNTVLNAAAGQVAIWQQLRGINTTVASGAAAGVEALAYAAAHITSGRADAVLAGGVDEVCYESALGFQRAERLTTAPGRRGRVAPFDAQRDGTALGEGAAFLALESAASARARGARVLGIVRGVATGFDPSIRRHGTSDGVALARTVQRAMTDAGVSVAEVSHVQASASGSPLLDAVEAAALATVFGTRVPVTALKGATGELLGASGALQTMAALDVLRTGQLPGCVGLETPLAGVSISLSALERSVTGNCAVVTAMSAEGTCAALVVGRA